MTVVVAHAQVAVVMHPAMAGVYDVVRVAVVGRRVTVPVPVPVSISVTMAVSGRMVVGARVADPMPVVATSVPGPVSLVAELTIVAVMRGGVAVRPDTGGAVMAVVFGRRRDGQRQHQGAQQQGKAHGMTPVGACLLKCGSRR